MSLIEIVVNGMKAQGESDEEIARVVDTMIREENMRMFEEMRRVDAMYLLQ